VIWTTRLRLGICLPPYGGRSLRSQLMIPGAIQTRDEIAYGPRPGSRECPIGGLVAGLGYRACTATKRFPALLLAIFTISFFCMAPSDFSPKQLAQLALHTGVTRAGLMRTYQAQARGDPFFKKQARRQGGPKTYRLSAKDKVPNRKLKSRSTSTAGWSASNNWDLPGAIKQSWSRTPQSMNLLAPEGFGYYDAFANNVSSTATHASIGPATGICCKTLCGTLNPNEAENPDPSDFIRGLINTSEGPILLYLMPAASNVQAVMFSVGLAPGTQNQVVKQCTFRTPQLSSTTAAPNLLPTSILATRASVRVRNITNNMNVGGDVRVLRQSVGFDFPDQLPGATDAQKRAAFDNLCEGVRTSAATTTYTGNTLRASHQMNSIVVDQSRATAFKDFEENRNSKTVPWKWVDDPLDPSAPPGVPANASVFPFEFEAHDPSFTPIVMLFEEYVNTNTAGEQGNVGNRYELTYLSQFLCHYRQGTVLANLAAAPNHSSAVHAKALPKEHQAGNVLRAAGEAAWNHRGQIAATLGALIM